MATGLDGVGRGGWEGEVKHIMGNEVYEQLLAMMTECKLQVLGGGGCL